jgi:hypothetical protein
MDAPLCFCIHVYDAAYPKVAPPPLVAIVRVLFLDTPYMLSCLCTPTCFAQAPTQIPWSRPRSKISIL